MSKSLFRKPFTTPERRAQVYEWSFHTVVMGFAGVWLPLVALLCFNVFNPKKAVLDGEFVVFAITLSAVSVGYFIKETPLKTRRTEIATYIGLMTVTLLGVILRTVLALAGEFGKQLVPNSKLIAVLTILLVGLSILLNFRLFAIQLELQETAEAPPVAPPGTTEVANITAEAKVHTVAAGVKI